MTYCFDLDGTICSDTQGNYDAAEPLPEIITSINQLYRDGHTILVFTARGSGTGRDWRAVTERQLTDWGVKFHHLIFGKPAADVYVDDKAVNIAEYRLVKLGKLSPDMAPAIFTPSCSARQ